MKNRFIEFKTWRNQEWKLQFINLHNIEAFVLSENLYGGKPAILAFPFGGQDSCYVLCITWEQLRAYLAQDEARG